MGVLLEPESWHINVFLACGLTSSTQIVLLTILLIKRHEIWCVANVKHTYWACKRVWFSPPSPTPLSLPHALFLKSKNIVHFTMSRLFCWWLETWISRSEAEVQSSGHRVFIKPHLGLSLLSWSTGERQWEGNVIEWCRECMRELRGAKRENGGKDKFRRSCFWVRVPC